ncbi:hypothetical protein [Kytococcus sedentarius]|uniref:hypothetical protein n=1 Tax=Kytococcus sedentarius TaxID=1276 RepID=UPI00385025A4
MQRPPVEEPEGADVMAVDHPQSSPSEAVMAALEDYAGRSDVVVICAVENSRGKWRRTVTFTLDAARRKYRRALANGHRAVLFTAQLQVTHTHAATLDALARFDAEGVEL